MSVSLKGLPVGLRPHTVGIGSNSTHLVYPSSEQGKFILEEFDSGDTHTLDAGNTSAVKFVFGKHAVALLTTTNVLFWSLDTAAPLESWDSKVEDVWAEYGNWVLQGPDVSFDPVLQESKHVTIEKPTPQAYKYQPVFVDGQQHLHVGSKRFDLGGIETLATIEEYVVASKGTTIKVLFNLQELGSAEVDEAVLALTAAVVDDELQAYCITPTKVAQFSLDLDFEPVESHSADGAQEPETEGTLYSGWFKQREAEPTESQPASSASDAQSSKESQDLLALLHNKLPPTSAPTTSSVPGPTPDSVTPPNRLPETGSSQELLDLIKPSPRPSPLNKAHKQVRKQEQSSDYVSREHFDSTVGALKQEIDELKLEIQHLRGGKAAEQAPSPQTTGADSSPKPASTGTPASVADAISRTMQGERHLKFFETKLDELKLYLDNAPDDRAQMLKLVLIDAYHHTKLSRTLVDGFGAPIVDPSFYYKIIGDEC